MTISKTKITKWVVEISSIIRIVAQINSRIAVKIKIAKILVLITLTLVCKNKIITYLTFVLKILISILLNLKHQYK